MPRPERAVIDEFVGHIETSLDKTAAEHPNPGTVGLHRLNRAEYANAVRDLLASTSTFPRCCPPMIRAKDSITSQTPSESRRRCWKATSAQPQRSAVLLSAILRSRPRPTPGAFLAIFRRLRTLRGCRSARVAASSSDYTFPLDAEYAFKIRTRSAGFGVGSGARARAHRDHSRWNAS